MAEVVRWINQRLEEIQRKTGELSGEAPAITPLRYRSIAGPLTDINSLIDYLDAVKKLNIKYIVENFDSCMSSVVEIYDMIEVLKKELDELRSLNFDLLREITRRVESLLISPCIFPARDVFAIIRELSEALEDAKLFAMTGKLEKASSRLKRALDAASAIYGFHEDLIGRLKELKGLIPNYETAVSKLKDYISDIIP